MRQATFYILNQTNELGSSIPAHFACACQIIADYYRQGARIFVHTDDQQHSHLIDELLWSFDADSFIAHNLAGEGPSYGSPVEISHTAPTNRRHILVNLATEPPEFVQKFQQIIDFVPAEESLKQLARARYSAYRRLGINLNTISV